jgi:hypothetical protein
MEVVGFDLLVDEQRLSYAAKLLVIRMLPSLELRRSDKHRQGDRFWAGTGSTRPRQERS